jgi:CelD/BcsL family acetyltransferase involved in cellulose biosynthesis
MPLHLTVEVVRTTIALLALGPEWRSLEREQQLPLPFATFDWAVSWWSHLHEDRHGVRDHLYIHAVRADGELVAVAPLMLTTRPGAGPLRHRAVQFFGADSNMTEIRGMVVRPGFESSAQSSVLDALRSSTDEWDELVWGGIPGEDEVRHELLDHAFADVTWAPPIHDYVLELPGSWDELRRGLGRNLKESLRRCANAPRRDGLELGFHVVRTGPEVAVAIDRFLELHRRRSQLTDTVHHGDVFSTANAKRFLHDVCARFAARGRLRIYVLTIDGETVATRIGFVVGTSLYLYYSGYDPRYRQYSVMTTTVAEAIKDAIAEGLTSVNLSTGTDVSKTRWRPQETTFRSASVVAPTRRAMFSHRIVTGAQQAMQFGPVRRVIGRMVMRYPD